MVRKIEIAFFGSSKYSLLVLEKLYDHQLFKVAAVITLPDKQCGRKKTLTPNPVKVFAKEHRLPVFTTPVSMYQYIKAKKTPRLDLGVGAWYGKILSPEILALPRHGVFNLHPSLLPRGRGPSPVQFAILGGEKEVGVSVILMDEKIDHGPLLAQAAVTIEPSETAADLYRKLLTLGGQILPIVISKFINFTDQQRAFPRQGSPPPNKIYSSARLLSFDIFLPPKEQEHQRATYTRNLIRTDGRINWEKSDAEIERMVRAFYPWPGAWTTLAELCLARFKIDHLKLRGGGKVVKILKAHLDSFGRLQIERLQIEGKKPISFREFERGYPNSQHKSKFRQNWWDL